MPIECAFDINHFTLRGKRWGESRGIPTIALHGWLDNCASFDFLAPKLPALDLVCLDLAGHGRSDYRHHRGAYNIWQDVGEIFAVADQLGWQRFNLLGHSRGAAIATIAAGTFPERIQNLALIDGGCPQVAEAEAAPEVLATSIGDINQRLAGQKPVYGTFAEAARAREKGLFALSHVDATALAERAVESVKGGYRWTHDLRLVAGSEVRLSLEQVNAFVQRISAQCVSVWGSDGLLAQIPELPPWLENHPKLNPVTIEGNHHLHMSRACDRVAGILNNHLFNRV